MDEESTRLRGELQQMQGHKEQLPQRLMQIQHSIQANGHNRPAAGQCFIARTRQEDTDGKQRECALASFLWHMHTHTHTHTCTHAQLCECQRKIQGYAAGHSDWKRKSERKW